MNSSTQNIAVEMVERFQIHENYQQSFPSSHTCKITLIDGRKVKRSILGPEIYILIQAIAKEKITFKRTKNKYELSWSPQGIDNFNSYADFSYSDFKMSLEPIETPLPNELLTSLFGKRTC